MGKVNFDDVLDKRIQKTTFNAIDVALDELGVAFAAEYMIKELKSNFRFDESETVGDLMVAIKNLAVDCFTSIDKKIGTQYDRTITRPLIDAVKTKIGLDRYAKIPR